MVAGKPSLSILKTPATAVKNLGDTGSFTLTVTNSAAATGATFGSLTVTDPVPPGLTIGPAPSGPGWDCSASSGQNVSCTITAAIAPGNSYTPITVPYKVAAGAAATTLSNTATETGGGDPTPHSSTATVTVLIPDMTIVKTHAGTNFLPGGSVTFTLTASNVGNGPAFQVVTVTDTPPAGLIPTSFSGPGWSCAPLPALSCTRNDTTLPGASAPPITMVATINATPGSTLINNAAVGGGGEVYLPNDFASDQIVIGGVPDMTIVKTHTGTAFVPGGSVAFTLTARNVGNAPTNGVVTVADTLPAGLSPVSISGAGWNCAALPALSCTRGDVLGPSGSAYPPLTLVAAIAGNATGTLVNNVVVSGGSEVNLTNDSASDSISVSIPDMTITKTHTAAIFLPGGSVTYTLTASNIGAGPTSGAVTVTEFPPPGLTATAISAPAPWSCVLTTLTCSTSTALASGAAYPAITVTASIGASAVGTLLNKAVVGGGSEVNLTNDTATDPITVLVPDLTIVKTHTGTSFTAGGSVTFTLTASNVGAGPTAGLVTVTDTLPAGLTATAINAPTPWTCVLSSLSCSTSATLASGAAYPSITVTASIGASALGTLTNKAVVGGGSEVNLTNDTATDPITLLVPDLTIVKTHTGTSFTAGGSVTFTLTASNVGAGPTSGLVTVTDALPAGLTATAISAPTPWNCVLSALTCSTTAALNPGAAYPPIAVTASIAQTASGTLLNKAVVGGGSEVNLTNDTASDSIVVTGIPDMTITKSHTGTPVRGGSVVYTLTASNVGGSPTSGTVTVTDTLPAGLTLTSMTGAGWSCVVTAPICSTNTILAPARLIPPLP